jgi:hypothetical protein
MKGFATIISTIGYNGKILKQVSFHMQVGNALYWINIHMLLMNKSVIVLYPFVSIDVRSNARGII